MTLTIKHQGIQKAVQVGDRLLPQTFFLEIVDDVDQPSLRIDIEMRDGVAECRAVHVVSVAAGREVQVRDLRSVKIQDLVEFAASHVAGPLPTTNAKGTITVRLLSHMDTADLKRTVKLLRSARSTTRQTLTDEVLRQVASIYRNHPGRDKAKAVADQFKKEPRTARMYLQRARQRIDPDTGQPFLGAAIRGKAGELS